LKRNNKEGIQLEKLMIVGGSGFLGGHLIQYSKDEFEVVATFKDHPFEMEGYKCIYLDITDYDKTENTIMKERPDLIILTAAQRNVDYCERNQKEVNRINVEGTRNIAMASKKIGAKLIYLSTDMVFDGTKESYHENDTTNPINHYGKTKLEGEKEVAKALDDFAIARVSVLYDWNLFEHTFNFVAWIYEGLKQGKPLKLFSDQHRNATYVKNACEALLSIYKEDEKGIFHVVGKNCVSRQFIGKKVAETFDFDEGLITTSTSDDFDWLAKRPKKCCLNVEKMEKRLGVKSMSIEEGLAAMKTDMG
jgi:dTDP-4-dehydrorhamnose reductase